MKKVYFYIFLVFIVILLTTYFSVKYNLNKGKELVFENLLTQKQKNFIKATFFPYEDRERLYGDIAIMEKKLFYLEQTISILKYVDFYDLEIRFKDSLKDIKTEEVLVPKVDNNLVFKKYKLIDGLYAGRSNLFPGTGYIDFDNDNLILMSARGVLGFSENNNGEIVFKQIKNNITNFLIKIIMINIDGLG